MQPSNTFRLDMDSAYRVPAISLGDMIHGLRQVYSRSLPLSVLFFALERHLVCFVSEADASHRKASGRTTLFLHCARIFVSYPLIALPFATCMSIRARRNVNERQDQPFARVQGKGGERRVR